MCSHLATTWSLRQNSTGNIPSVYVSQNIEGDVRRTILHSTSFPQPRFFAHALELLRTSIYERESLASASTFTAISTGDAQRFEALYGRIPCAIASPVCEQSFTDRQIDADQPLEACISGSYLWEAKLRNLRMFLTAARKPFAEAGVKTTVVGQMSPSNLERFRRMWPEVNFTGPVPSPAMYLQRARIGVIPELAGGGFKLKQLEYVSAGLPVYALRKAVADVPLHDRVSARLFDSMQQLTSGIAHDIADIATLNRLQLAARRLALEDKWDDVSRLSKCIEQALDHVLSRSNHGRLVPNGT